MANSEDIEKKYRHAILVLQAISQRSGYHKDGYCDEWSEAAAFGDCRRAAESALKYLGEQTVMPNKAGGDLGGAFRRHYEAERV